MKIEGNAVASFGYVLTPEQLEEAKEQWKTAGWKVARVERVVEYIESTNTEPIPGGETTRVHLVTSQYEPDPE